LKKHRIKHSIRKTIFEELPYCYNKQPPWEKYIKNWKPIIKETYQNSFKMQFVDGEQRYIEWLREFERKFPNAHAQGLARKEHEPK